MLSDVPFGPTAAQARQLVLDELSKAEYQHARPSWLDQLASSFLHWLQSLRVTGPGGTSTGAIAIILVVIAIALIVAFLVFGLPRINRRSTVTGSLFGEDDDRSADAIRRSARAAASADDFTSAVAEQFRAVARSLAERTVLTVSPGTTAHDFSVRASGAFPDLGAALGAAATAFDDVRYLDRDGTEAQYDALVELDRRLEASRPVLAPILGPAFESERT